MMIACDIPLSLINSHIVVVDTWPSNVESLHCINFAQLYSSSGQKSNFISLYFPLLLHSKCCSAELPLKGEAHMHYLDLSGYHINAVHMSPAHNRILVLQCFKCNNVVNICNGIMFDFSLGLPYIILMAKFYMY